MKIITTVALLASGLLAQTPTMEGSFFMEESGASAVSGRGFQLAGALKLDGQGGVSGAQFVKDPGGTVSRSVSGRYELAASGVGTMSLAYATTDSEGTAITGTANYRLARAASGRISLLRTDAGYPAEGELTPEAGDPAALRGSFIVEEESVDASRQSMLAQGLWQFDGQGGVTALVAMKTFYQAAEVSLSGRLEPQTDGTAQLRLSTAPALSADGDILAPTVITYRLLPGARTFQLLREDAGVASAVEVQVQ